MLTCRLVDFPSCPGCPERYTGCHGTSPRAQGTLWGQYPVRVLYVRMAQGQAYSLVLAPRINTGCYHRQRYSKAEPASSPFCSLTSTYAHRNVLWGPQHKSVWEGWWKQAARYLLAGAFYEFQVWMGEGALLVSRGAAVTKTWLSSKSFKGTL